MSIYRGQGGAPSATDSLSLNRIIQLETDAGISASEASASAAAADASATAAGISETNSASSEALTAADALSTAADVVLTHADVVLTNADVATTAANVILTDASAIAAGLDAVATEADAIATAADRVQTGLDVIATGADAASTAIDASTASTAASNASISETNAGISETNALASELSAAQSALDAATDFSVPARNSTLNQEAVTQGTSTRTGMESLLGTATTTIDTTGDLEALVISKDRINVENWYVSDAVRGDFYSSFNTTAAEIATVPTVTTDDVTFRFQTNKKTTGLTNRNKAYTAHYNSDMGFSIVGYEGDFVNGHEIPHHLNVDEDTNTLHIFKDRDAVASWLVQSSLFGLGGLLTINSTNALTTDAINAGTILSNDTVSLGSAATYNSLGNNYISYHFADSDVCRIGRYIGTGAAGNYVSTAHKKFQSFKVGWLMVKNLTTAADWRIVDAIRGDNYLEANTSNAETPNNTFDFVDDGFVCLVTGPDVNALNDEYIFLAFAETALDGTKQTTDYSYPTTADTLSIAQDTLISFANGFSASGQVDTQESVGAGVTYTLGVGFEDKHLWLYKDKAGAYGVTENRPLEGLTRNLADTYGVESPLDASLRTTAKHFDYESSTGVALASGEVSTEEVYNAFNKSTLSSSKWSVLSTTTSTIQYKGLEKRILKSWRIRASDDADTVPRQFTVEGSNDGLNWTAIDSTYTASDFTDPSIGLWSDLQDTSANATEYLYHRLNITLNHGDGAATEICELEFNTILPSDYYDVLKGVQHGYLIGNELVTNGAFDVDTTGWTPINSTLSSVSGNLRITQTAGSGQARTYINNLIVGEKYEVSLDLVGFSGASTAFYIGIDNANAAAYAILSFSSAPQTRKYSFIAEATTAVLVALQGDSVGFHEWDNISLERVLSPIERTYLAELRTNADGDVATYRNLPVAKQRFNEVEVHGDLVVRGDIENRGVATAWVNFDLTKNPPLINEAFNVKDIVDLGTGKYKIKPEVDFDNVGFTVLGTSNGWVVKEDETVSRNTKEIYMQAYNTSVVLTDHSSISITVFGGKD